MKRVESDILGALQQDLGKSQEEGDSTEVSIVLNDIRVHVKQVSKWSKPRGVSTPIRVKVPLEELRKAFHTE